MKRMKRNLQRTLRSLAYLSLGSISLDTALAADTPAAQSGKQEYPQEYLQSRAWGYRHENVLGTSMEVTVRASSRQVADRAEAALLASIDRENLILSAWNRESELSRWLATRGTPEHVSPELFEVLNLFDQWRERTHGALDASADTAVRLWQNATAAGRMPTRTEIMQAVKTMQQPHWQLDHTAGSATRLTGAPLALASFTKSYIAHHAAQAAMASGATGVMLNIGGDIVTLGDITQVVEIANPMSDAEGDAPIEEIVVRDRAVATSGSYRRGFDLVDTSLGRPEFSHILDPRTAQPTGHVLSATVISDDAVTAGALATAFSVLTPHESREVAAKIPGVEYMIVARSGEHIVSKGWPSYQTGSLRQASYVVPIGAKSGVAPGSLWNQSDELVINLELARIDDFRYRRPYVAVWVEDQNHSLVRTIALWYERPRWLPDLTAWYGENQMRNGGRDTDLARTTSSATRAPGKYSLKWDGKDNDGNLVKQGKYTICIEAVRQHGGHQVVRQEMDFDGAPQQVKLAGGNELGAGTLDYRKR
jgi:FAD:protein FMN transferase